MSVSWSRQVGIHEVSSPCSGGLVLLGLALRALVGRSRLEHLCWDLSLDTTSPEGVGNRTEKEQWGEGGSYLQSAGVWKLQKLPQEAAVIQWEKEEPASPL